MNRNKKLVYTLIAEGDAEYAFIPIYLRLLALKHTIQAVPGNLAFKGQNAGKSKVLKEAKDIATRALQKEHNLIVVGIDLDTPDYEVEQPLFLAEQQKLINALDKVYKSFSHIIICFVPVQAIEQWLTYQAYKTGITEKFNHNGLESKHQAELKKLLYKGNYSGPNMERVAKSIAEKADFDELAKQSRSFAHFHKQVVAFLDNYTR